MRKYKVNLTFKHGYSGEEFIYETYEEATEFIKTVLDHKTGNIIVKIDIVNKNEDETKS